MNMKRASLCIAGGVALAGLAQGQTVVLYEETFPAVTDGDPLSQVGWADDIPADNPNRLTGSGDGDTDFGFFWAYEPIPAAGTTNAVAFYTSTALDAGSTGQAFTNITPTAFSNVLFRVRIKDRWDTDNMASRFAVQMDGSTWYASTTSLPVPSFNGTSSETWAYYEQTFVPGAANWRHLTVSGDGSGTGATVGGTASADLAGQITGAGVVVQYWTDDGTHEFDDFQVRATPFGALAPTIDQDPPNRTVYETENVVLSVVASGTPPLNYRWRESGAPLTDGGNLSGANTDRLTFTSVTLADAGIYDVVVSNDAGSATSAVASLVVQAVPPDLVYEEVFPWTGSGSISSVGWTNAVGAQPQRMYEDPSGSGDGHVYAYEGTAATTAFYTTTELDNGISGLPFVAIDPDLYPALTLQAEIQPSFNPANVEARMAVRMSAAGGGGGDLAAISAAGGNSIRIDWDGGANVTLQQALSLGETATWTNIPGTAGAATIEVPGTAPASYYRTTSGPSAGWFVSAQPLPVNSTLGAEIQYLGFSRSAAQWNTLTVDATAATIGGAAPSDLAGEIVGAGLVFVHSAAGTHNFDDFRITTNEAPVAAPVIVWLPQSLTVYEGAGVSFAVSALGTPPFVYEWSLDSAILTDGPGISGATTDVLTVTGVTAADAGEYTIQVSNVAGSDDSYYLQFNVFLVDPVPAGLLYAEQFPFAGPGAAAKPLARVGWAVDTPSTGDRLYKASGEATNDAAGAAFAFEDGPATSALYTTATLDPGVSGLPFAPLAFGTTYPSLELAVDIAPSFAASNVTARFAVQIDGANWFVSTNSLPVPTGTDSPTFTPYTQPVTPAAAGWNELTLTGSGPAFGPAASTPINGSLTGAGIVLTHTGPGTFNIDNFEIRE